MEEHKMDINEPEVKVKVNPILLEFEDEEEDGPGTAAGIAAVFQKKKSLFSMSTSDYKKAELESRQFRNGTTGKNHQTKKGRRKAKNVDVDPNPSSTSRKNQADIDLDDFLQLEREANQILGRDDGLHPEYRYGRVGSTHQNDDQYNKENGKTSPGLVLMEVDLADSDNDLSQERKSRKAVAESLTEPTVIDVDDVLTDLDDSQSELGQMILFYICLNGERFSLMFYENDFIDDVRKKVALKSGIPGMEPESLQMFLENAILEDKNTVKESRIADSSTIDVFITHKSEQELYEEGSTAIIKLKMQTSDRRGRQNCFVYVKRSATMGVVRDKYAAEIGVNPALMKLESDGEFVSLDSTPEECDLENEFVIDVTIASAEQEIKE